MKAMSLYFAPVFMVMAFLFGGFCWPATADMYAEIHGQGVYTTAQKADADRKIEALGFEFRQGGFVRLAYRSEQALDGMFRIAYLNLKRRGHRKLAEEISSEWSERRGTLIMLSLNLGPSGRDIGDYEPLAQWLANAYDKIEAALGLEICRALRLSDIKTMNYGLRVVFQPCTYGEYEFNLHFVHDSLYRGVFPVVAYWVTSITCSVATFGAGYFFVCSPIAMLVELGADRVVAPWLSPKLYSLACGDSEF